MATVETYAELIKRVIREHAQIKPSYDGIAVEVIYKVNEGRPNIADQIVNGKIDLVINTPLGRDSFFDDRSVRRAATMAQVPCITTLTGASAAVSAIKALRSQALTVRSLQDYYSGVEAVRSR